MYKVIGLLGILVMVGIGLSLTASPLAAQDTSAVGRAAEGIPTDAPAQTQPPDTSRTLTTRQGTEGQAAPGAAPEPAMAAETEERDEAGAAMPTTSSSLPALAAVGLAVVALGVGLRLVRKS
jgi:hypothetical protein